MSIDRHYTVVAPGIIPTRMTLVVAHFTMRALRAEGINAVVRLWENSPGVKS